MTDQEPIPTGGEYARKILRGFNALKDLGALPRPEVLWRRTSLDFVHDCLAMMDKLPSQTRDEFASTLPFSNLELQLLPLIAHEDGRILVEVADRLAEWIERSPVLVDETPAHVADFLYCLRPHLDLWSERQAVEVTVQRLLGLENPSS